MKEVKLTKTQVALFRAWNNDLSGKLNLFRELLSEVLSSRMEKIAQDLGLDTENEKWSFDSSSLSFKCNEIVEPTKTIPGRKRGRPKKVEDISEEEVELTDEDIVEDRELPV